jgi:hypothetical protein
MITKIKGIICSNCKEKGIQNRTVIEIFTKPLRIGFRCLKCSAYSYLKKFNNVD